MRERMNEVLGEHTGRTPEQIAKDTERDYYMSATEAKDYGIVDRVASRRPVKKLNGGSATASKAKNPEGETVSLT